MHYIIGEGGWIGLLLLISFYESCKYGDIQTFHVVNAVAQFLGHVAIGDSRATQVPEG